MGLNVYYDELDSVGRDAVPWFGLMNLWLKNNNIEGKLIATKHHRYHRNEVLLLLLFLSTDSQYNKIVLNAFKYVTAFRNTNISFLKLYKHKENFYNHRVGNKLIKY